MKDSVCYIICYNQKANFGFDRGVELQSEFPMLKGTGKFHRHLSINKALLEDHELLISIIKSFFNDLSILNHVNVDSQNYYKTNVINCKLNKRMTIFLI